MAIMALEAIRMSSSSGDVVLPQLLSLRLVLTGWVFAESFRVQLFRRDSAGLKYRLEFLISLEFTFFYIERTNFTDTYFISLRYTNILERIFFSLSFFNAPAGEIFFAIHEIFRNMWCETTTRYYTHFKLYEAHFSLLLKTEDSFSQSGVPSCEKL